MTKTHTGLGHQVPPHQAANADSEQLRPGSAQTSSVGVGTGSAANALARVSLFAHLPSSGAANAERSGSAESLPPRLVQAWPSVLGAASSAHDLQASRAREILLQALQPSQLTVSDAASSQGGTSFDRGAPAPIPFDVFGWNKPKGTSASGGQSVPRAAAPAGRGAVFNLEPYALQGRLADSAPFGKSIVPKIGWSTDESTPSSAASLGGTDGLSQTRLSSINKLLAEPNAVFRYNAAGKFHTLEALGGEKIAEVADVFAHGSFSEIAMANVQGQPPAILRTVYVQGYGKESLAARSVLSSRAKNVARELDAMQAVNSPLLPSAIYATGQGALRYLQPRFATDLYKHAQYRLFDKNPVQEKLLLTAEIARLANDIFSQLAVLHDAGFIHHDLKPANILINKEGALLADFGLSKRVQASAGIADARAHGTPNYFPPELREQGSTWTVHGQARPYDATSKDIFGAGLSLLMHIVGREKLREFGWSKPGKMHLLTKSWQAWASNRWPEAIASQFGEGAQLAELVERKTNGDTLQLLTRALHPHAESRPAAHELATIAKAAALRVRTEMGLTEAQASAMLEARAARSIDLEYKARNFTGAAAGVLARPGEGQGK